MTKREWIDRLFNSKIAYPVFGLFVLYFVLKVINYLFFSNLFLYLDYQLDYSAPQTEFIKKLLLMVIIAPIGETLLFQFLLKLLLDKLEVTNYYVVLFIITLLFTLIHQHFQLLVFIYFFISCGILTDFYLRVQKWASTGYALLKTIILHALYNLTLLLITIYEKYI